MKKEEFLLPIVEIVMFERNASILTTSTTDSGDREGTDLPEDEF